MNPNTLNNLRAETEPKSQDIEIARSELAELIDERDDLLATLKICERLFKEALPKFNWAASFLDANEIFLLNNVPLNVSKTIMRAEGLTE